MNTVTGRLRGNKSRVRVGNFFIVAGEFSLADIVSGAGLAL